MRIVVYHASFENDEKYEKCWSELIRSAHSHGYTVIQLTAKDEATTYGDDVLRFDVVPRTMNYSREICLAAFLSEHAEADEQYVLLEPDFSILRPLPGIPDGIDLVLLSREYRQKNAVPGVRFFRRSALPFFERCRDECSEMTVKKKRWNCDVKAMAKVIGSWDKYQDGDIQEHCGVKVLFRSARPYGLAPGERDPYLLNLSKVPEYQGWKYRRTMYKAQ